MGTRYFYSILYSDGETETMVAENLIKAGDMQIGSLPLYPVGTRVKAK